MTASDLIGMMETWCPNVSNGCDFEGIVASLNNHVATCPFQSSVCPQPEKQLKRKPLDPDNLLKINKLHIIHKYPPFIRVSGTKTDLVQVMGEHHYLQTREEINKYFEDYYATYFEQCCGNLIPADCAFHFLIQSEVCANWNFDKDTMLVFTHENFPIDATGEMLSEPVEEVLDDIRRQVVKFYLAHLNVSSGKLVVKANSITPFIP